MDRKKVIAFLGEDWSRMETAIRASLSSDIDLLNYTNESILSHSGKMLRPLLSLTMSRACNAAQMSCGEDSVLVAAASELLHNATLLHDDVADSSDLRRGVPTVRSILGAPASVLVGDYWLVKAMELILSCGRQAERQIHLFSKTLSDLAQGEMLQLQKASSCDTTLDDYLRIIYCKTASLFEVACQSAAIASGAPEQMENAARDYARNLGIAFQIKDDIFDYSEKASVGKPVGVDVLEQKITAPLLGAMQLAGAEKEKEVREMVRQIADCQDNAATIMDFVRENGGLQWARELLECYVDKALGALQVFPESDAKAFLSELAAYTAEREI